MVCDRSPWAIAVAKAGTEDGSGLIGGSCIVDPNGRIVAEAETLADEIIVADLDLDLCRQGKDKMFNFAAHRRPEQYSAITERAGVIEPDGRAVAVLVEHRAHASAGTRYAKDFPTPVPASMSWMPPSMT